MGLSPGLRHNAQLAARESLNAGRALVASPESLHTYLREIAHDVEQLRQLPTIADRILRKRDVLLPKWQPVAARYVESGEVFNNLIFAYCVIWLFDAGDFDTALDWAEVAIAQSQPTPENIKSTFPAFVADTVLAWAQREAEHGHSVEPYFSRVFTHIRHDWRLHEEINAKWFKFAALLLLRDSKGRPMPSAVLDASILLAADELLAQAHAFHPPVGVKSLREKIAMRLRKLDPLPHGSADAGEDAARLLAQHATDPGQSAFQQSAQDAAP